MVNWLSEGANIAKLLMVSTAVAILVLFATGSTLLLFPVALAWAAVLPLCIISGLDTWGERGIAILIFGLVLAFFKWMG